MRTKDPSRSNKRALGGVVAAKASALQPYTLAQSLEVNGPLQSKLQCAGKMRGGSIGGPSDVPIHKTDQLRGFEIQDEKVVFHLRDLFLTEWIH